MDLHIHPPTSGHGGHVTNGAGQFQWPTSHVGILHPFSEEGDARSRAEDFKRFVAAALSGASYNEAKEAIDASQHQAETRKSVYEEMGLLYVPKQSNRIIVTPVGKQLYDLLAIGDNGDVTRKRVDAVIAWALSNSQINRPQSRGSPSPSQQEWTTCNIRPYAAGWQAILDLGGWLRLTELFGVLAHAHKVADYPAALETIRRARVEGTPLLDEGRFEKGRDLFNPRIYWRSHLSVGRTLLNWDDAQLTLRHDKRALLQTVLAVSGGCSAGPSQVSFQARAYGSTEEYFERIAGRACPAFLFAGSLRVENVGEEPITILQEYPSEVRGDDVIVEGGPELCAIALNAPCYHRSVPDRILRLAVKEDSPDYKVRLFLRRGRPFRGTF
jgi:hypothetical protein